MGFQLWVHVYRSIGRHDKVSNRVCHPFPQQSFWGHVLLLVVVEALVGGNSDVNRSVKTRLACPVLFQSIIETRTASMPMPAMACLVGMVGLVGVSKKTSLDGEARSSVKIVDSGA